MDEAVDGLRRRSNTHPVKCYLCHIVVHSGGASRLLMSVDGLDYAWLCPSCKEWIGRLSPDETLILRVFSNNWSEDDDTPDWDLG